MEVSLSQLYHDPESRPFNDPISNYLFIFPDKLKVSILFSPISRSFLILWRIFAMLILTL
jgi:hypothetical protein